jgi:hypothetical protein
MQTNNHIPGQLDAFKEQTAQTERDGLEAARRKWAEEKASGRWKKQLSDRKKLSDRQRRRTSRA